MAVCNPQTLMTEAGCLACLSEKTLLAIAVKLLCTISGMATCNPQTLMNDAKCFACLGEKQLLAIVVQLLCNISVDGTGGGGTGGVTCGDVDPVAAPAANCTLYYNRSDSTLWYWDVNDTAWYEMINT
jgi:hypothetical protein